MCVTVYVLDLDLSPRADGVQLAPGPITVNVTVTVVVKRECTSAVTYALCIHRVLVCVCMYAHTPSSVVNYAPYLTSSPNPAVHAFALESFYNFTLGDDNPLSTYTYSIVSGNTNNSFAVRGVLTAFPSATGCAVPA